MIVYHASALDLTPEDCECFDVQITDPPYSPHVHENATSTGTDGAGVLTRDLGFAPLTPELAAAIAVAAGSVRRWSVIFSDIEGTPIWREACASAEYVRTVPWIRWSQPQLSGDRPPSGCELISIFHRQEIGPRGGTKPIKKHWNGPGSLTHYAERCLRGVDKHPTEKPLDLGLSLVSHFSDPGEHVFDPCAGRGTFGLACRLLGREFTGLEIDEAEVRRANNRLVGVLSGRDEERAKEWILSTREEAGRVPVPRAPDGSDVKTHERAQRRIADAARVEANLGKIRNRKA
jgi:hypothetical protein